MFEVTVEETFAAGHYLRNYKGKCENPHGHNYRVQVTLKGRELDKSGLLVDFTELKHIMRHLIQNLDHKMLNDIEPFTTLNPSAENMAQYFFQQASARLEEHTHNRVSVKQVTVWETDTSVASYYE